MPEVRSQGPRPASSADGWQASRCPCVYSGQLTPPFHSTDSWSSQGTCLMPTLLLWTDKLISSSAKNQRLSGRKPSNSSSLPGVLCNLSLSAPGLTASLILTGRDILSVLQGSFHLKPRLSHPYLLWLFLYSLLLFPILLLSYTPRLVLFPISYK